MELNHLRHFYEVAKSGSFTEAARRLHISQSALSKAVALLEEAEGVKLFERSKQGVTLTRVGTEVFQKAQNLFQVLSDIENVCRGTKEKCEGPLRIGASDHVTNYLLLHAISRLRDRYPNVRPSILTGAPNELVGALLSDEIECGLFFTQIEVPQIIYEPVLSVEMAAVCAPKLLNAREKSSSLLRDTIEKAGYISSVQSQYRSSPSEELLAALGKNPRVVFESNSQETQKRYCIDGGGVAFLAKFMVEEELKVGSLTEIPLKKPISLPLHLARRKGRSLSLNALTFLEMFKSKA